jgi:hypothetical protein
MQMPRLTLCGAAYDPKRKICVLFGSGSYENRRNDLWAYAPSSDTWTCLQQNAPDADGKTMPKAFYASGSMAAAFCYDSGQDLYWLLDSWQNRCLWSYDPKTRTWRKSSFSPADVKYPMAGLGYHPGLQALFSVCGPFDVKTGRVNPGVNSPDGVIGGYQPSSAVMSNGLSSPDENGCLLAFNRDKQNKPVTWLFDPARAMWTVLQPTQSPLARTHANVVYHKSLKVLVMYGGTVFMDKERETMSETWLYAPHLTTWIQIEPESHPPPCGSGALWYDEAGDQIIFFGGEHREQETWGLKLTPAGQGKGS